MQAVQASLLGVFASHALLMAFALKLKMSAALRQPDRSSRQPGNAQHNQACLGSSLSHVRANACQLLHKASCVFSPR